MDLELSAKILSCCLNQDLSTSEMLEKVGGGHDRVIQLIRELKERGLLLQATMGKKTAGRPRHSLQSSSLGKRFVTEYNRLCLLPLRSNKNDLKRAVHQAQLARKLIQGGESPYARLLEVTSLARNIARTAKAQHSTR